MLKSTSIVDLKLHQRRKRAFSAWAVSRLLCSIESRTSITCPKAINPIPTTAELMIDKII